MVCRQFYIKPVSQQMTPLPADRIIPASPFTNIGLDFAGPLYLKNRGEKAAVTLCKQQDNRTVFAGVTTYSCQKRYV
jgi:hypothetical protein